MMRRNALPLLILALGLLAASFAGIQTVNASPWVMVNQPFVRRVTGINQPVEITASGNDGTPPYTFQWYTTFLDPTVPSEQWITEVVPDANSATFKFVQSVPGRYGISIRLTDSKGDSEYQSFQPIGIVVTVQSTPIVQATPTPSPTLPSLNISYLLEENKTYTENSVPLNFSLTQPAEWIAYSLDGQAAVIINGNTTLTGLSNGYHTVTIYANDTNGNAATSQIITFIVNVPATFSTIEASAAVVIVIGIIVVAVFLFKKQKQPRINMIQRMHYFCYYFFILRRTAGFKSEIFFSANSKVSSAANSRLTKTPVLPTVSLFIKA